MSHVDVGTWVWAEWVGTRFNLDVAGREGQDRRGGGGSGWRPTGEPAPRRLRTLQLRVNVETGVEAEERSSRCRSGCTVSAYSRRLGARTASGLGVAVGLPDEHGELVLFETEVMEAFAAPIPLTNTLTGYPSEGTSSTGTRTTAHCTRGAVSCRSSAGLRSLRTLVYVACGRNGA